MTTAALETIGETKTAPHRANDRGHDPRSRALSNDDPTVPYGYCHCGCGQKTSIAPQTKTSAGWVKGEPLKFVKSHTAYHAKQHFIETPETNCWEWQGAIHSGGYGVLGREYVHRLVYEELIGPVPEGLQLDHLCRNRRCCNPGHLEPVTQAENLQRGAKATLTPENVIEIRKLLAEGELTQTQIAERYGIDNSNISRIKSGAHWCNI